MPLGLPSVAPSGYLDKSQPYTGRRAGPARSAVLLGAPHGDTSGFPLITSVSPHGAFGVLDRLGSVLAGAAADRVFDADDENLPAPNLALTRPAGDRELVDD